MLINALCMIASLIRILREQVPLRTQLFFVVRELE